MARPTINKPQPTQQRPPQVIMGQTIPSLPYPGVDPGKSWNPNQHQRLVMPTQPPIAPVIPPDMKDENIEAREPIQISDDLNLQQLYEARRNCSLSKNAWMHEALGDRIQQLRDEVATAHYYNTMMAMQHLCIAWYKSSKKTMPKEAQEFFEGVQPTNE